MAPAQGQRARAKAIADAQQQAEHMARVAGVRLGPIVSIQATGPHRPRPVPVTMSMRSETIESASAPPVERGELTISQQVQMRFELERP